MTDTYIRSGLDSEPDDELPAERCIRQHLATIVEAEERDERERAATEIMRLVEDLAGQSQESGVCRAEIEQLRDRLDGLYYQILDHAEELRLLRGDRGGRMPNDTAIARLL